jgi:hypothetical protein
VEFPDIVPPDIDAPEQAYRPVEFPDIVPPDIDAPEQ